MSSTPTKPNGAGPKTNCLGLTLKDYKGAPSTLCAGCGHDAISAAVSQIFFDLGIEQSKVAKLSGIGCSSKTPAYFLNNSFGFNTVHGRMPTVATGAKLANRELNVLAVSGDGDTASIGMGHFVHLLRRNVRMVYMIENNGVYGLTKGQFSATADFDSTSKHGARNDLEAIDLCSLAVQLGCDFVARSFSGDRKQLLPLMKAAFKHHGTAILDIVSPCVTFNDHEGSTRSYKYTREHGRALHEVVFIEGGEDIRVDYEAGETKDVRMHDGSFITLKKLGEDYDHHNRAEAIRVCNEARGDQKIITGLLYVNPDSRSFTEVVNMVDKPLSQCDDQDLRPGPQALAELMGEMS